MKVKLEVEPTITKKYLLERQTQETYMEYYLGIPVGKGLKCSTLREDKSPTCSYYWNKQGDLIFKDFSGHFCGNFIDVVMFINDCSYYKALQIIANDFGYIERKNIPRNPKPITQSTNKLEHTGPAKIQVEIQDFSEEELNWWNQYGITKDILKKFQVYSCKSVFLNESYLTGSSKKQMIFGYYRGKNAEGIELWRIYYPGKKTYKFLSNWSSKLIQGAKQLPKEGELLIVTKSLKDCMTLYSLGYTAIAPISENLFLSESQFKKLSERFKKVICFYDNDLAGITNMNKIRKQFDVKCLWIPRKYGAKDISDFYKKYGRNKTLELINDAKERIE